MQRQPRRHVSAHVTKATTLEQLEDELALVLEALDTGTGTTLTATWRGLCGLSFIVQVTPTGRIDGFLPIGPLVNGPHQSLVVERMAKLVSWRWQWPEQAVDESSAEIMAGLRCNWMMPTCSILDSFDSVTYLAKSWSRDHHYDEVASDLLISFSIATIGAVPTDLHLEAVRWPVRPGTKGQPIDLAACTAR